MLKIFTFTAHTLNAFITQKIVVCPVDPTDALILLKRARNQLKRSNEMCVCVYIEQKYIYHSWDKADSVIVKINNPAKFCGVCSRDL